MKKTAIVCLVNAVVLSVAGAPSEKTYAAEPFQTLAPTSVVFSADSESYTKETMVWDANAFMRLRKNKAGQTKITSRDRQFCRLFLKAYIESTLRLLACRHYLKENGLAIPRESIEAARKKFCLSFGRYSKVNKRWQNLGDLKYMFGKDGPRLDDFVNNWAAIDVATNAMVRLNPVTVTDAEVTNRLNWLAKYNARAVATNALVHARATNVWNRIVRQELTFDEAATNYSEDAYISDGCEWGSFSMNQIADDPELLARVTTMKVGDITPPVKSDNGLAIVRLDEKDDNKIYTFSRVFFRLPQFFEIETSEEAREVILKRKTRQMIEETTQHEIEKLSVAYPNGKNLFK